MDSKSYQDHFFKKAKKEGYRSRSAFKLIELNNKFKFLKNGINILDIGCFPGGWCQVIKKKIKGGKILGIDKKSTTLVPGGLQSARKIHHGIRPEPRRTVHRSPLVTSMKENRASLGPVSVSLAPISTRKLSAERLPLSNRWFPLSIVQSRVLS